ncbi:hypothetical protein ACQPYK_09655 [Streptosporangium sp. CA-135522]|uniref:hypothetical protein n=1 Tax=Streptosporangium sp. CA-135522 TaxID=3240072 RepID=UPI003D8CF772
MADPRRFDEREFRAWLGYRRMRPLLDAQISHDLTHDPGLSDPDHVESVRRHLIDLLTDEQIQTLGDIADTVLEHLAEARHDAGP